MDVQGLRMKALETKDAIHERMLKLPREGAQGERRTLEEANSAMAELLKRYETGEWKASANGNSTIAMEDEE